MLAVNLFYEALYAKRVAVGVSLIAMMCNWESFVLFYMTNYYSMICTFDCMKEESLLLR